MKLRHKILSGLLIIIGLLIVYGIVWITIDFVETMAIEYILGI
jgi:hypothetical protein